MATQGAANTWASQVNRTQKILLFGVGQWLKWAAIAQHAYAVGVERADRIGERRLLDDHDAGRLVDEQVLAMNPPAIRAWLWSLNTYHWLR